MMERKVRECQLCKKRCPQCETANEIAKGRMYATNEVIRLQKELEEYKRLEEQGLVLKLPCKVGKTVYLLERHRISSREKPLTCIIDEFTISNKECYAVLNGNEPFFAMRRFRAINIKHFGEILFLTKEEAEAKLKEMQNKQ